MSLKDHCENSDALIMSDIESKSSTIDLNTRQQNREAYYIPPWFKKIDSKYRTVVIGVCCFLVAVFFISILIPTGKDHQESENNMTGKETSKNSAPTGKIDAKEVSETENNGEEEVLYESKMETDETDEEVNKNYDTDGEVEQPRNFNFSEKIIFTDYNKIKHYDIKTKKISDLLEARNEIVALDVVDSSIFYVEDNSKVLKSYSQTFGNASYPKRIQPKAIAIDSLTKKVYILDQMFGTITVMDMISRGFDSNYDYYSHNIYNSHGIVLSDLENLHDIVLDTNHGVMFIIQYSKSILRVNLDGKNLTSIVKNRKVTEITLDRKRKRLFYVDKFSGIISVDYDGQDELQFKKFKYHVMSLAIVEDQIFWQPYSHLMGLKKSFFYLCSANQRTCDKHKTLPIYFENPKIFKGSVDFSPADKMKNPCEINNGNCSDLCLLTSEKRRSCACHLGFELDTDFESCVSVTDYFIYSENDIVRAISTENRSTFRDIILPTPISVNFAKNKSVVDFDYDLRNDNFIFTDGNTIYKINLVNEGQQTYVVEQDSNCYFEDLAFDKLSNNLYYLKKCREYYDDYYLYHLMLISNINSENPFQKILLMHNIQLEGTKIHHVYVHDDLGYLIYTIDSDSQMIQVKNLDGTETQNSNWLSKVQTSNPVIALDSDENRIYYVFQNKFIFYVEWNSENEFPGCEVPVNNMTSFSVNKKYIYFSNLTSIWRFDHETGTSTRIVPSFDDFNFDKKISGVKIFSTTTIFHKKENLCLKNNGNCQQFCFSKPKKSCGCEHGRHLLYDSTHCS